MPALCTCIFTWSKNNCLLYCLWERQMRFIPKKSFSISDWLLLSYIILCEFTCTSSQPNYVTTEQISVELCRQYGKCLVESPMSHSLEMKLQCSMQREKSMFTHLKYRQTTTTTTTTNSIGKQYFMSPRLLGLGSTIILGCSWPKGRLEGKGREGSVGSYRYLIVLFYL